MSRTIKVQGHDSFDDDNRDDDGCIPFSSFMEVMLLHSELDDQLDVFNPVPAHHTRIILSTNIAESSVTLPSVHFVMDLGTHKQVRYSPRFDCDELQKTWISVAAAKQRAGRCGRLAPGTVLRLYPQSVHDNPNIMPPYDIPEMQRVSLAATVLRLKMTAEEPDDDGQERESIMRRNSNRSVALDPSLCNLNDPHSVLSGCIQPPEVDKIDAAYDELIKNDALKLPANTGANFPNDTEFDDAASDDISSSSLHDGNSSSIQLQRQRHQSAHITPLGRFFASIPFSFRLARLIALGIVFGPRYLPLSVVLACSLGAHHDVMLKPMQKYGLDTPKKNSEPKGGIEGVNTGATPRKGIREERDFVSTVSAVTKMRVWADGGLGSDAIACIRIVHAYITYRASIEDLKFNRQRFLLNQWCVDRCVHIKRIQTLLSSIREVSLRLHDMVHGEAESGALLKLSALCGGRRKRDRASDWQTSMSSSHSSRAKPSRSTVSSVRHAQPRNHFQQLGSMDMDDDDSGSDAEMVTESQPPSNPCNGKHAKATRIETKQDDPRLHLLSLNQDKVTVLRLMLSAGLAANLLQGTVKTRSLQPSIAKARDIAGRPIHMDPMRTVTLQGSKALCEPNIDKLRSRPELAYFAIEEIVAQSSVTRKNGAEYLKLAVEFSASSNDQKSATFCVTLNGTPTPLSPGDSKDDVVPLLRLPPFEQLNFSRLLSSRGLAGFALPDLTTAIPTVHTLCEPALPGSGVSWQLFHQPQSVSIERSSLLASLRTYAAPMNQVKDALAAGMNPDLRVTHDAAPPFVNEKKVQSSACEPTASSRATAASSSSSSTTAYAKTKYAVWAVAVALFQIQTPNVRSLSAEKVTLLPCGPDADITSVLLSVLIDGELQMRGERIVSIGEKDDIHPSFDLPASLPPIVKDQLLSLRSTLRTVFDSDFVAMMSKRGEIPASFLRIIRLIHNIDKNGIDHDIEQMQPPRPDSSRMDGQYNGSTSTDTTGSNTATTNSATDSSSSSSSSAATSSGTPPSSSLPIQPPSSARFDQRFGAEYVCEWLVSYIRQHATPVPGHAGVIGFKRSIPSSRFFLSHKMTLKEAAGGKNIKALVAERDDIFQCARDTKKKKVWLVLRRDLQLAQRAVSAQAQLPSSLPTGGNVNDINRQGDILGHTPAVGHSQAVPHKEEQTALAEGENLGGAMSDTVACDWLCKSIHDHAGSGFMDISVLSSKWRKSHNSRSFQRMLGMKILPFCRERPHLFIANVVKYVATVALTADTLTRIKQSSASNTTQRTASIATSSAIHVASIYRQLPLSLSFPARILELAAPLVSALVLLLIVLLTLIHPQVSNSGSALLYPIPLSPCFSALCVPTLPRTLLSSFERMRNRRLTTKN